MLILIFQGDDTSMDASLLLSVIVFLLGLVILIRGSDFFVGSAAFIAKHFGVSELIIGLTLVSMGTSFPELGASVYASYSGKGGIAVGNVVGSNIANIALVLGVCLMLRSIKVKRKMLTRDGIIMLGVSLLFSIFVFWDVVLWEGIVLMVIFGAYIIFLYRQNKDEMKSEALQRAIDEGIEHDIYIGREIAKAIIEEDEKGPEDKPQESEKKESKVSPSMEIAKLVLGCLGVIIGAKLMVDSAVVIAEEIGISETVIGSTLIAFGTSVPELAVSVVAILKKYEQISIGNIIGSNIFNILLVIGASSLVRDLAVDDQLLFINIPIMLLVAALLLIFMAVRDRLERWQGGIFVAIYAAFLILNFAG